MAYEQAGKFKIHFFYWVIAQYYGVSPRYLKKSLTLIQKALKGPPAADKATALADTLCYTQSLSEPIIELYSKAAQFNKYILKATGKEMSRTQAKSIMAYALSEECDHPKITKRCVANMLKRHPIAK